MMQSLFTAVWTAPFAIAIAYVAAGLIVVVYTMIGNVVRHLWEDLQAIVRAIRSADWGGPYEADESDDATGWRKPAKFKNINETMAHIGRHPSLDGLGSGMGSQDVTTRFNR